MSTQYQTGEDYPAYQAGITTGVPTILGHVAAITAYQNRVKYLANVLEAPPAGNGVTVPAMPSVGINVANNVNGIFDYSPQRYIL